jgi:hypothetical protein
MPLDPSLRGKLLERLQATYDACRRSSSTGSLQYLSQVVIDRAGEPCPFRDVAEPWQWLIASRLAPAIDSVAGLRPDYRGPRNFFFTLPRGHDKSSLIGRLCSWLLAFSRHPIRCIAGAADKEQAGLLAEFMRTESGLNPWLNERLHFATWRVDGLPTGSRLKILAADEKSTFGLKEDLHILDELTHWDKRGLWDAVYSGSHKRSAGGQSKSITIIITNAGLLRTWQHDIYQEALKSRNWYCYHAPGQLARWMSAEAVAEIRRMLPAPLARRVLDNCWIDPGEDCGFVTRGEAEACVEPSWFRQERGRPEFSYVASVDYGVVKDRTVMCVGHEHDGRIWPDRMDVIQGSRERRVPVAMVEQWIDDVNRDFFRPVLVLDPYQMEGTAQKYEGQQEVIRLEARGGKTNFEMANCLRNAILNRRLALYAGMGALSVDGKVDDLIDELASVLLKAMVYGYRIDHVASGHDDRVICLAQMVLEVVKRTGAVVLPTGTRWF